MQNSKIQICDVIIHPGESANLAMPLPEQFSCAPIYMPIRVIHGKKKGPCLVIFSTLNGDELNGMEIANRIVKETSADDISGTIMAIPVLNTYALTHFPATLPTGETLDSCFPGVEDGSFGERMAYMFTNEILKKADYCIELETGKLNHNILPQVYCNFDNIKARRLAKAFQSPVITNVPLENNKLRQITEELQIPLLVYEAGEAMRFDENSISMGVNGIRNVMRAIDMLPKEPTTEINPIFSQDEDWIIAPRGGILHTDVSLGQMLEQGSKIGEIRDPFGSEQCFVVKAPREGIVVGINTTPLIHEGLPIFKIASFLDYSKAENIIEEWDKNQPDGELNDK
jgi:predicted deacylase